MPSDPRPTPPRLMPPPVRPLALPPAIIRPPARAAAHLAVARDGAVGADAAGAEEVRRDVDGVLDVRLQDAQPAAHQQRVRIAAADAERAVSVAQGLDGPLDVDVDPDLRGGRWSGRILSNA